MTSCKKQDTGSVARDWANRYRRLARWLAALVLLAGLLLRVPPAAAQTPIALENLLIALWPEFDRAAVLVIIDGSLPAGTALPAQVTLNMPAAAGQPSATAYTAADGSLLAAPFTTTPAGDAIIVTLAVETLKFRLEYYDPALSQTGSQRAYTFDWTSASAVRGAVVRWQQPAGASDLTTAPALTAVGAGEFGLQYYESDLGALAAGQQVQIAFGYTKPDDTLSSVAVGAAAPAATSAAGTGSTAAAPNLTPLLLVVGGVALLGGGVLGFIYLQRQSRTSARNRRPPRRHRPGGSGQRETAPARLSTERFTEAERLGFKQRQAAARGEPPAAPPAGPAPAGAAFCTQCGQKLRPGDKFCRQCGTPVRGAENN